MTNRKTPLRGVASLVRIQSTPVTVLTLLLGYAVASGNVLTREIIPLAVIGATGHWGFYSLNDLLDLDWDLEQERFGKPIVSGALSEEIGWGISISLMSVSIISSFYLFPKAAFGAWSIAALFGIVYNMRSKIDIYSEIYLVIWGASVVLTGSLYHGELNYASVLLALVVGVHMVWMTVMGDLKDIGNGERSLPQELGCRLVDSGFGTEALDISERFFKVSLYLVAFELFLIGAMASIGDLGAVQVIEIVLVITMLVAIMRSAVSVINQPAPFSRDLMKKQIAKHEILTIIAVMIPVFVLSGMDIGVVAVVIGSVIWGVSWQTLLYGHPLRFP